MSAVDTVRGRRWIAAPLSAGLVLLLLLGSVGAGLRVPGLTLLAGLPGLGLLDYRTLSGEAYLPLRADYVNALLGTTIGSDPGSAPARAASSGAAPVALDRPASAPGASASAAAPGVAAPVLEHPFTNDDFGQAMTVRRLPFSARTTTAGATREPGEPGGCASTGGTAWYRYTPKDDRPLVADSFGSDHAVSIGVFRGAGLGDLQMESCSTSAAGDAEVSLTPKAGTTYHFQVTGIVNGGSTVFRLRGLGVLTQVSQRGYGPLGNDPGAFGAVSGDGAVVAFKEDCGIWVVDRRSGRRDLISRTFHGQPACGSYPSLSRDGRFVSLSSAERLVEEDTNNGIDMFVHDRATGQTTRVSVTSDGLQGWENDNELDGTWGSLSSNGRYVAFSSPLNGLVPGDRNGRSDVFVHDRRTGRTTIEDVDTEGRATGSGGFPSISDDGRFVVFGSSSTDLAEADYGSRPPGSAKLNVFRRDRLSGTTQIVSVTPDGVADNQGYRSAMSGDGQIVVWTSTSAHLVPDDTNGISDVFLRDMRSNQIHRVSVSSKGEQQLDSILAPETDNFQMGATARYVSLSADGRYVAFDSRAANLVAGDTNGATDVFVHDRSALSTIRVSVTTMGQEGDGDSYRPWISSDGQVVAFESVASRFTGSTPEWSDVLVHDRNGT